MPIDIVAIALNQPVASSFEQGIANDPVRLPSAATWREAMLVPETRLRGPDDAKLDLWLHKVGMETVGVTAEPVDPARQAWRSCGKGLNFGACLSHAPAALPLCKGEGLARTNIRAA